MHVRFSPNLLGRYVHAAQVIMLLVSPELSMAEILQLMAQFR